MKASARALKKRYFLFIISVVVVIVSSQAVVQYDLSRQSADARLINQAGRQRMLSQRISKVALYTFYNAKEQTPVTLQLADSLKLLADQFEAAHKDLIKRNEEEEKSIAIRHHLNQNTPYLNIIVKSARDIGDDPTADITQQLGDLTKAELPFLLEMEKTVRTYQREAENKLAYLKSIEIILATLAILILIAEFIFIFVPTLNQLNVTNFKLIQLNRLLTESNNQLETSEKEIRNNLTQIQTLRDDVQYREKQYRELIEDAIDIIFELNDAGQFVFVNRVMEGISGYAQSEILGKTYDVLVHPGDVEGMRNFYKKQLRDKEPSSYFEFRMVRKDGGIVWIGQNAHFSFVGDWASKVSVIARDITQLKHVQHQLVEREQYYRLLSENSTDVISLTNAHRQFTFVSQSATEVMGFEPQEMIGKYTWEFIHPDDLEKIKIIGETIRASGNHVELEFRIRHKEGHYLWVESHSKRFYPVNSNEVFVQSSFRDITARKIAEEKLEESERLYRLLSENSRDVVSLHAIDGAFEYISPSCIDLHGYTPDELVGKKGSVFIHPDDAAAIEKTAPKMLEMMQKDLPLEPMQFRIMTKHRGPVWAENVIKPVFKNGILTGFQSTVRDITSRKQIEISLQETKDQALYATKAKSQFLSMMSHEIRTPMNAVIGLTNLLLDKGPRADQREELQLLKFSGENLLTIINDILDFSKIEADKVQLEYINVDMKELVEKITKMYRPRAVEKKITLNLNFSPHMPRYIVADPVRLGQIITNLVGNAIKFTEAGQVELLINHEHEDEETIRFTISVTDTGIGIPEDKLATIFESFSQAEVTTTRKYGGSGLGLSITRYLVELMGGKIQVKSTVGSGSSFYFTLTCNKGQRIPEEHSSNKDYTQFLQRKNIHILLVEDNTVNQLVVTGFLHAWNISVSIANNGKEAIQSITQKNYDLVLMDLQMPEMSGYEATEIIRSMPDPYYKQVPIVALTASAIGDVRSKVLAAGMNDFLTKPFQPLELQEIIVKHGGIVDATPPAPMSGNLSESLESITKGNKEFERRLLSSALENMNELKTEFERAWKTNNAEVYHAIVHKCKMSLNFVKNNSLTQMIKEMNVLVHEDGTASIPPDLKTRFISTLETVIEDINKLLR